MKLTKYLWIVIVIVLIDQVSKLLVHYNMDLGRAGEIMVLGEWFRLHYIHNPGMAFGMELNFAYGKLLLSLFRIIAIIGLGYYLSIQIKAKANPFFITCLAMILGGAIGNAIDGIFYGVLFDIVTPDAITPWFHGQVIDMVYFPMIDTTYPDWVPFVGGERFSFFSAIFNIADSCISVGVTLLAIFFLFFASTVQKEPTANNEKKV